MRGGKLERFGARTTIVRARFAVTVLACAAAAMAAACGGSDGTALQFPDGGTEDAGPDAPATSDDSGGGGVTVDSGMDSATPSPDSSLPPPADSGVDSAAPIDTGVPPQDSGVDSAQPIDTGTPSEDSGVDSAMPSEDSGSPDSGTPSEDSGTEDSGTPDMDSAVPPPEDSGVDSAPPIDSTAPPPPPDDSGVDAPVDSGVDAPVDTGVDAPVDSGVDATPACVGKTCTALGYNCGLALDNCGSVINCNAGASVTTVCPTSQICGLKAPNQCATEASYTCTPKTCAALGYNCGYADDGCGTQIYCGDPANCVAPAYCGGGGFDTCGVGLDAGCDPDAGLCNHLTACPAGEGATLTGIVNLPAPEWSTVDGGVGDPVPNALVYVAQRDVTAFDAGVACTTCGNDLAGEPLMQPVSTAPEGTFSLAGVPAGVANLNLVVQLGRWRKVTPVGPFTACSTTALPSPITLPRDHTEGNIPATAIMTGYTDAVECLLRKMGIRDSEFTGPTGGGRVQIYSSFGANPYGAAAGAKPPADAGEGGTDDNLMGGGFNSYDQVLLPCMENPFPLPFGGSYFQDYTDLGGRAYVSHYQYGFLEEDSEVTDIVGWDFDKKYQTDAGLSQLGFSNNTQLSPFATWSGENGVYADAGPGFPQFDIPYIGHDTYGVGGLANDWINYTFPASVDPGQEEAFSVVDLSIEIPVQPTPQPGVPQCGRVVYADFHAENVSPASQPTFPAECNELPLDTSERVAEYMMMELGRCDPAGCKPQTCTELGYQCGGAGDGCGGAIDIDGGCGTCPTGQSCGGPAGVGHCFTFDAGVCVPATCPTGQNCGEIADGCGNIVSCGTCTLPQTCGGGGTANRCGP